MFSSASSTSESRFGRFDRTIARVLVAVLLAMTPFPASAGDEFQDANNTTFDNSIVTLDNSQAGQTTFDIDTNRTTIGWEDLQQPNNNTLEFNFADSNSVVFNNIGAQHPSNLNGSVISNGTVAFANPFGIFIGEDAVIDVGNLVAIGANVSRYDFMTSQSMIVPLTGSIENNGIILANGNVSLLGRNVVNNGEITVEHGHVLAAAGRELALRDWDAVTADFLAPTNFLDSLSGDTVENNGSITAPNAALIGGRILNFGEIEVEDGTLLMVAADSVWVTEFDNPVLIKVPNFHPSSDQTVAAQSGDAQYAIENHGRIDAGLGHVRLAASDPLGFGIRQGTGSGALPASIAAQRIELEGGETGRVHLEGVIDASDLSDGGLGGTIDITGSMIVLDGAEIDASGSLGGGTIQIGGEQEGRGELQRARVVVVDEDTEIRADAVQHGDGGRIILFAEDLTSVDARISARGGDDGGDGGFVETSGLLHFAISRTPDLSAARGEAGSWLIDPFNITIQNLVDIPGEPEPQPPDCPGEGISCFNKAIDAILSPFFDGDGFDGILRTVDPDDNVAWSNVVEANLIADALAAGTDVTLSTQAFGVDTGTDDGDIDIIDEIVIENADTLEGTTAKLTLLAAGNINVDNDIKSIVSFSMPNGRTNLALSIELRANDVAQNQSDRDYGTDLLEGDVTINADILTGGGDVTISGSSVVQQSGLTIDTDGGSVDIRSGTVGPNGNPLIFNNDSDGPSFDNVTPSPRIEIMGLIDTRDGSDPGGDVSMIASSLNVSTPQGGDDLLELVPGELIMAGQIVTGDSMLMDDLTDGGDITLSGGSTPNAFGENFAGSAAITGTIISSGGDVSIASNHVDPNGETGSFEVSFVEPALGEGGVIDVAFGLGDSITTEGGALSIGGARTQSIQLDGTLDTTQTDTTENGRIQLVALDSSSVDSEANDFGSGEIIVGNTTATTISTSSLVIESRDITFSDGAGINPVTLTAVGSSTATLPELTAEEEGSLPLTSEEVRISGSRSLVFNQNTQITGETIRIAAAFQPIDEVPDPIDPNERPSNESRLIFGGTNGAGQTAADGVRLNGDFISISVGDGTTAETGTSTTPTDFGVQRLTRGAYDGLQLRSTGDEMLRPEEIEIAQDGDFTITNVAPTADGQLDLGSAYDTATIGPNELQITLESSDGILTIEDAAALNNDPGKSSVVLNGGLFLPASPSDPLTVVFGDGIQALGSIGTGTTAFSVESLTVSTPGDFTITQQIVDSISVANELIFEAGRNTGVALAAEYGTLSVEGGITLQAGDRLALLAAASGFGDLVFAGALTTLVANDVDLRAGAGVDSENTDSDTRSRITGLQPSLAIRDANGNAFGDTTSTATSFSYRQDAAIDAETDLPTLPQFGLVPGTGFRDDGDVVYRVRSDEGNIDLDDDSGMDELDRFRNSALSLIGLESSSVPAIDVSGDFTFDGKQIELGGISDFEFTQILANAFNRSGLDADEEMTLRAGTGIAGDLSFQSSVIVKAPSISLVAGNGFNLSDEVQFESMIDVGTAKFDLTSPGNSTFVFHTDSLFDVGDLPDDGQFVGGLPNILAIRTDLATLDLFNFDITTLPLDLTNVNPPRLILEAESISLSQTDGDDLELTSIPNLELRLRTNNLFLTAADSDLSAADDAVVLIGDRIGDTHPLVGVDSDFDGESLLIEAFDRDATIATVENLGSPSEDPDNPGQFDLGQGRGPTIINLTQDGEVTPGNLFNRGSVSGLLARSSFDDDEGLPIATTYSISSTVNAARIAPENVNASNLVISGLADSPDAEGIIFEPGSGPTPGIFDFSSVFATTESSIFIKDGTQISATTTASLAAGFLAIDAEDPGLIFGTLSFEDGLETTRISGNRVLLTAGPAFKLDGPNLDGDGEPIPVPDNLLPRIDFEFLDELVLTGDAEDSSIDIRQTASLNSSDPEGDFVTPIQAGMMGTEKWASLVVDVVQGNLNLDQLDVLKDLAKSLIGRNTGLDATLTVNVPDQAITTTPFADFDGIVEFQSNDVTFVTSDVSTSINLATENLLLVSFDPSLTLQTEDERGRLRSDPDALERPIVRIQQAIDFTETELARPDQYFVINALGERRVRSDLSGIDIELRTTGSVLTLDNDIRARVTRANLILESGADSDILADVDILLNGATPGFEGLGYPALQLTSLEVITPDTILGSTPIGIGDGTITFRPFMIDGSPEILTIGSTGDQRLDGIIDLETTLSTSGRDIIFTADITQSTAPDAGLHVATTGEVIFQGNIGSPSDPLNHLWVVFDSEITTRMPRVQFGRRIDVNNDGIAETPIDSDQTVWLLEDLLFAAYDFANGDLTTAIEDGLTAISTLLDLENFLADLGLGREQATTFATIGKALGDLGFNLANGNFIMASGEKLSVGGTAAISAFASNGIVTLGDVSALGEDTSACALDVANCGLVVRASEIGLVRRRSGIVLDRTGETQQDGGPSILANSIDFGIVEPRTIGSGRSFHFGLPNPFDIPNTPRFLDNFPLFEIQSSGEPLDTGDFQFLFSAGEFADQVPSLRPTGASRSDLSGAFGPKVAPTPTRLIPEALEPKNVDQLLDLAVEAHPTPTAVRIARLDSAAVINDLGLPWDDESAAVTTARLDADDAAAAIALYEELFGPEGERSGEIREILQGALDGYLANTRARRVIGFELRRFVKNRPSTLLDAYKTLDSLDVLFRYHRRLGLSPGEFRRIQKSWLRRIQPDGITLDELAEAIHPSRYVRGSDILDIFGQ